MRKITLLLFLYLGMVYGVSIEEIQAKSDAGYNDVFLTFPSPLKQKIKLLYDEKKEIYFIQGLSSPKPFFQRFSKGALDSIMIYADGNVLYLSMKPSSNQGFSIDLALSRDKKSLRLRFAPLQSLANQSQELARKSLANKSIESLAAPKTSEIKPASMQSFSNQEVGVGTWQYNLVMIFLLLLIIAFLLAQKKIRKNRGRGSLPFVQNYPIDSKNRIISIGMKDRSYLIFEGSKGYVLLEKIKPKEKRVIQKS
ncbi:hypothetical protein [Helicobacter mustelae]|uniref:Putative inner membrane protein n=1 Tax=Helicobacter mustelae (strain ATCC 43772 / CCUG 25715 / CIP 103759 / LMG 18044 / NCTC 12198 / R85-136P) TaxID=679897 RepID=D3UGX1_HELM1|nr:hypothetical protein [Helicobacter mustelae]CBG39743.1 Putative inner membrane protein [Helicobacter mustelae 12198]SQH71249.1 Uncharacterised protein [Helicobacter mustelae]